MALPELDPEQFNELLIRIADGVFADNINQGYASISLAAEALKEKTDDIRMIRKALARSVYGSCPELNLRDTFELF